MQAIPVIYEENIADGGRLLEGTDMPVGQIALGARDIKYSS